MADTTAGSRRPESPVAETLALLRDSGIDADLLWCVAPSMEISHALGAGSRPSGEIRARERARRRIHDHASQVRRRRVARMVLAGGVLFGWDTVNQERTLRPILSALGESDRPKAVWQPPISTHRMRGAAVEYENSVGLFPARGDQAFADGRSLEVLLGRARRDLTSALAVIDASSPDCVVVASQQGVLARAMTEAARRRDTPTVYFPHAPIAETPWYRDIPFQYAGLRGAAEVGVVTDWVYPNPRVQPVGHVSTVAPAFPDALDRSLILLATSPHGGELLRKVVDVVAGAGLVPVVAPHPRQRVGDLRNVLPRQWEVSRPGFTRELLDRGPALVIQSSSGVGLEALARGIPVIDIQLPGSSPTYLYLRGGPVRIAQDSSALTLEAEAALSDAADRGKRELLVAFASGWGGPSGTESIRRSVELIETARTSSKLVRARILDRWEWVVTRGPDEG